MSLNDDNFKEDLRRRLAQAERTIEILWALLNRSQGQSTGSSNYETVTLTTVGGNGGGALQDANFVYTFTTADGVQHVGVSPFMFRLRAAKQAGIGTWDPDFQGGKLVWCDERPDAGPCPAT